MKIDHIAIWVVSLEEMRSFYVKYFNMNCSEKYINPTKRFSSYFLSFDNGARIEIMHRPDIGNLPFKKDLTIGLTHFSISVGSINKVNELTEILRKDGFTIIGEPRTTGDGYYESVVLDPEGNHVEITK